MRILEFDSVPSKDIPLQHCPEWAYPEEDNWQEKDYNYRLNMCDEIFLLSVDSQIVGHIGLQDRTIRSIHINESHQGKGLSRKLYQHLFDTFEEFSSDDAREPVIDYLWKYFMKEKPNQIRYDEDEKKYLFSQTGF